VNLVGGKGSTGSGGNGGYVYLYQDYGTGGGHVKIFNAGKADASFEMPKPAPYFGKSSTTLTVGSAVTVQNYSSQGTGHTGTAIGKAFLVTDNQLWLRTTGADVEVTGIHVTANGKLTFDPSTDGGSTSLSLTLTNDIQNDGTITTTADGSGNRYSLYLTASNYFATGKIDLSGTGSGGSGGNLNLYTGSQIINTGSVSTKGADGPSGGTGGSINVETGMNWPESGLSFNNDGPWNSSGGKGTSGTGGSAGYMYFYVGQRFNNGPNGKMSLIGGDCSGASCTSGGNGNEFYVSEEEEFCGFVNAADINVSGGNCINGTACNGGAGNQIYIYAYNDLITSSGDLTANGGDGSGTGNGGNAYNGDAIYMYTYDGDSYDIYRPSGSITVSGNLSAKGGKGANGGNAGNVDLYSDFEYTALGQEIVMLGYTDIHSDGGAGVTSGGNGNYLYLYNTYSHPQDQTRAGYVPGGSVINYANFTGSGGNASGGQGGSAGYLYMYTQNSYFFGTGVEKALNFGDITLNGGSSVGANGGTAGYFEVYGVDGAENHGAIKVIGGAASGGAFTGGGVSSDSYLRSDGPLVNDNSITMAGGNGSGVGSAGGSTGQQLMLLGSSVNNSSDPNLSTPASIHNDGGKGAANGGNAGNIIMLTTGPTGHTINMMKTITAKGGTGTAKGSDSTITIDGSDVTSMFQ
jgi:hypothetical protein